MVYDHQLCQQHHNVFETSQQIEMIQPQPEGSVPSEIGRRIQLFLRVVHNEYPCLISQFEAEYHSHTGQSISPQMYGFKENAWEEMFRHISTVQVETLLIGHPSVSARPLKRSLVQHLFCTLDTCKFFDFDIECENFDYNQVDVDSDKFRNSYEELVASLTVKDLMDVAQDKNDSDSFNFKYNNNFLEEYKEYFSEDIPEMGTASSRSFRSVAVGPGFEMNSSVNIPDDIISTLEEKSCSKSSLNPSIELNDQVSIALNDFGVGIGISIEMNNNVSSSNSNPVRNSENQENRSPVVEVTCDDLDLTSVNSQLSDQIDVFSQENETWRQIQEADNIIGHRLQMLNQICNKIPIKIEVEVKASSSGKECNLQQNRTKRQMSSPAFDLDSPSKKICIYNKDLISHSDSLTILPLSPTVNIHVNEVSSDVDDLENFLGTAPSPPLDNADVDGADPISLSDSFTNRNCAPDPSTSNQHNLLNHDFSEFLNLQRSVLDVDDTNEILAKDQSDKGGLGKIEKRERTSAKCDNSQKPTQRYSRPNTLRNPDLWKSVFSSGHENCFIIFACGDGDNNCICKKTNTSWQQLDDLFLPRGSILYAEIIRPIDSQIKVVNIIDAASLGWKNVQSFKFEKRHKKCKKFSKLMNSKNPTRTHFTCLSAVGMGKISHALKKLAKSNGIVTLADGLAFKPAEILFLKAFSSRGCRRSSNSHPDFKSTIRNLISWELKNNRETLPK